MYQKIAFFTVVFQSLGLLWAQGPPLPVTPEDMPRVPKPILLPAGETLPKTLDPSDPPPPSRGVNGLPLKAALAGDVPPLTVMRNFEGPALMRSIAGVNSAENRRGAYYWHVSDLWNICHFRDKGGSHWYGWRTGETFHWIFYFRGHFWWHDKAAQRWLYYYEGYWWWPGAGQVAVYPIHGDYYLCDKQGRLLKDIGSR